MEAFDRFVEIISKLRGPDGCPWDKEQTHRSLTPYCVEEAYEVVDAILEDDAQELKKELGDLLLQIVLHAQIASENKTFTMKQVIEEISEKMVRRHPHVFSDVKIENSKQVVEQWSEIKQKEGKRILEGIPKHAPELYRAHQIGVKAASVGFDWKNTKDVLEKVHEEMNELQAAKTHEEKSEEMGDLLFCLAQYSRHLGLDPEQCLRLANQKFLRRFGFIEDRLVADQKKPKDLSDLDWERYWNQAKKDPTTRP